MDSPPRTRNRNRKQKKNGRKSQSSSSQMESPSKHTRTRNRKQNHRRCRNTIPIQDFLTPIQRFSTPIQSLEDKEYEERRRLLGNRDWIDLPPELMAAAFTRVPIVHVLNTVQLVCRSWRRICKDPLVWKTIHLNDYDVTLRYHYTGLQSVAKIAVDRSCGQLEDISIEYFATPELLQYITDRSPRLASLRLARCNLWRGKEFSEALSNLTMLTCLDLSLSTGYITQVIGHIGRCCPLLKSFKYNKLVHRDIDRCRFFETEDSNVYADYLREEYDYHGDFVHLSERRYCDEEASVVASNMPGIHHLMLVGRDLTNVGLQAILDGCTRLVSLDLRLCRNINLVGDLGERCRDQIKEFRAPRDPAHEYTYRTRARRWSGWSSDYEFDPDILFSWENYDPYDNLAQGSLSDQHHGNLSDQHHGNLSDQHHDNLSDQHHGNMSDQHHDNLSDQYYDYLSDHQDQGDLYDIQTMMEYLSCDQGYVSDQDTGYVSGLDSSQWPKLRGRGVAGVQHEE